MSSFLVTFRFAVQSTRFADGYHRGLTGKQAVWASKNTGVIAHSQRVSWKTLTSPNYYNITAFHIKTSFCTCVTEFGPSVMGISHTCHMVSQVVVFACSLSYGIYISCAMPSKFASTSCENASPSHLYAFSILHLISSSSCDDTNTIYPPQADHSRKHLYNT